MSAVVTSTRDEGTAILQAIVPSRPETAEWQSRLCAYRFSGAPDDPYIWLSAVYALQAVNEGNYGVGSVITLGDRVVARGYNHLLNPYMRTDRHAEMEALTEFEERFRNPESILDFKLYTSLECCPMCAVRIINSGLRLVRYSASDPECGVLERWDSLPPFWTRMAAQRTPAQRFERAHCSAELTDWCGQIFAINEEENSRRVARR